MSSEHPDFDGSGERRAWDSILPGMREKIGSADKLYREEATPEEMQKQSMDKKLSLKELSIELMLAQATLWARAGRYADAERLLTELLDRQVPTALDLQARIYAQRGQFREAHDCWKKALQLDPANEAYVAGIQRLKLSWPSRERKTGDPF